MCPHPSQIIPPRRPVRSPGLDPAAVLGRTEALPLIPGGTAFIGQALVGSAIAAFGLLLAWVARAGDGVGTGYRHRRGTGRTGAGTSSGRSF